MPRGRCRVPVRRRSALRAPYAPPGMMIDVGGQHLHLVCAGTGRPTVLFESGIAASSLSWARVLRDVATFTRACAYDRAGLGWSEPANATNGRADADRVARRPGQCGDGGPAVLVGHSFGAFFVVRLRSGEHPDDVAGLVLLDPPSEWHPNDPTTGASAARWHSAVARRRAPGASRRRAGLSRPVGWRGTGHSAQVRSRLRANRRAYPGAIGRRGAEAPTRSASRRAGALVSAEMLSGNGGSSGSARRDDSRG